MDDREQAQAEEAIIETITAELDALGRLWMDYGKQAGGFNPESGALYGSIQFTRTKVLDYVAMLAVDAKRYRKLSAANEEDQGFWWALAKQEDKDVFLDGGYEAIRALDSPKPPQEQDR